MSALAHTLLELEPPAQPSLTPALRELYDSDLAFPKRGSRPYVIANFVSTLDGVASFMIPGQSSGGTVSGCDPTDRFIMGLLRASVDAVIVGANTVQDVNPDDLWIPEFTYPEAKQLYAEYRRALGKPQYPLVVVVSGKMRVDLKRAVFRRPDVPTVLITAGAGETALLKGGASEMPWPHTRRLPGDLNGFVSPATILNLLHSEFQVGTLLHEGGPTLLGQFLRADQVDELFLTVAPQVAGRLPQSNRPGVVQGVEFSPPQAPWWQLLSIKQARNHLYLRYRRKTGA